MSVPLEAVDLTVGYDGADFAGFARQPSQRTVQGVLEEAISDMNGAPTLTRGAGRTDAGVHAIGQRVAFDPVREIPLRGWIRGLNAALPEDVVVLDAQHRALGYNPRFDSTHKTYRYLLQVREHRDPLWRARAWWLPMSRQLPEGGLDLVAMRAAAATWIGLRDFRAFRAADDDREQTQRTMHSIEVIERWADDPSLLAVDVTGSAFMKNMVRIMVGTLVEVGRGRLTVGDAAALTLPGADRRDAGTTAPAHGLTLVEVFLGRQAGSAP